jgi:hypothetical protein
MKTLAQFVEIEEEQVKAMCDEIILCQTWFSIDWKGVSGMATYLLAFNCQLYC